MSRKVMYECALVLMLCLILSSQSIYALDDTKIFFAGDSTGTCCLASLYGEDLYQESLFNMLRDTPPSGFIIEPDREIKSLIPCNTSQPDESGYGGLKILDWQTECVDASGNGVCSWSCSDCPHPDFVQYRFREGLFRRSHDCCCSARKSCIDQSDAQYVMLALLNNDLLNLYDLYNGDVDLVVEAAKSLITDLTEQGKTVIWISYCPIRYGALGKGKISCSNLITCTYAINSNAEYFYEQITPWIENQPQVYLIDFFSHIKEMYGQEVTYFTDTYQYDGFHLNTNGHQLYYDFVYEQLKEIVTTEAD